MTRYIGTDHDGTPVLIHIWDDGTGELAYRHEGRWGVPVMLKHDPDVHVPAQQGASS